MKLMSLDLPQLQKERQSGQGLLPTGCSEAQGPSRGSPSPVWSAHCVSRDLPSLAEAQSDPLRFLLSKIFASACYVLDALLGAEHKQKDTTPVSMELRVW